MTETMERFIQEDNSHRTLIRLYANGTVLIGRQYLSDGAWVDDQDCGALIDPEEMVIIDEMRSQTSTLTDIHEGDDLHRLQVERDRLWDEAERLGRALGIEREEQAKANQRADAAERRESYWRSMHREHCGTAICNAEDQANEIFAPARQTTTKLVHFARVPFHAVCGADVPNQSTAAYPDPVTCQACIAIAWPCAIHAWPMNAADPCMRCGELPGKPSEYSSSRDKEPSK